ncbi:hypothetical protein PR048_005618 [Dryococelus australis]|uniref:Uncharacterized protein n=1 Tax=Dryococelus australis TaxID=614101 RepID=A0ABQ9I8N3_9NEOP|nr:hypothetical protein PR048_005618 [Dryococelus australis]
MAVATSGRALPTVCLGIPIRAEHLYSTKEITTDQHPSVRGMCEGKDHCENPLNMLCELGLTGASQSCTRLMRSLLLIHYAHSQQPTNHALHICQSCRAAGALFTFKPGTECVCHCVLDVTTLFSMISFPRVVFRLLADIRRYIGCLYKLCENVVLTDMLLSLAHISCISNYVRPKFANMLDLKQSRHPMLDFICCTEPVANNVVCNFDILLKAPTFFISPIYKLICCINSIHVYHICMWELCLTMPLVGGISRASLVSPALSFRHCSVLTSITLICS